MLAFGKPRFCHRFRWFNERLNRQHWPLSLALNVQRQLIDLRPSQRVSQPASQPAQVGSKRKRSTVPPTRVLFTNS
jgi:hypothetical protein